MLLTRESAASQQSAKRLKQSGLSPIIFPLFEITSTGNPMPDADFDGIVVTSANALRFFDQQQAEALFELPLFVVGARTRAHAEQVGFRKTEKHASDAAALALQVASHFSDAEKPVRLLYPCGTVRSFDMAGALVSDRIEIKLWEIYDRKNIVPGKSEFGSFLKASSGGFHFHYSAKSAQHFARTVEMYGFQGLLGSSIAICISEKVSAVLNKEPYRQILVANTPCEAAMIEAASAHTG